MNLTDRLPNVAKAAFAALILLVVLPFLAAFKLYETLRNGIALACEKWLKKPFFADKLFKSYYEQCVQKRQQLCPHLKGAKLVESEFSEPFTFAFISRNDATGLERLFGEALLCFFACFGIYPNFELNARKHRIILDIMPSAQMNADFINSLYGLENACFKAHESLLKFAKLLQKTSDFSEYKIAGKYEFARLKKAQIDKIKGVVQNAKTWLDDELKSLENADFQSLNEAQKKRALNALQGTEKKQMSNSLQRAEEKHFLNSFQRAKKIHALINGEFDLADKLGV